MPYFHFIQTKLDSKAGQIKGLDVTFQMHGIVKNFDIIKYLKNGKNQKFKKKREKIGKMAQKGNKVKIFFSGDQSSIQNEKNEHC